MREVTIGAPKYRVNQEIRAREVRLIAEDNANVGVISTREALERASSVGLDLVEVSPNAEPPVCRIMDFGKFLYAKQKKEREARKQQKQIEIKEVRMRPKTADHHMEIGIRRARRFLEKGNKVKVRVQFRAREITYPEIGREMLDEFAAALHDIGVIEQYPNMEGSTMLMVLAPLAEKKKG